MRFATIIMVLALFFACEAIYWIDGPVGKAIRYEVRNAQKTVIHLSNLTPFEWDEAYFYDPYTPRELICKDLCIPEKSCPQKIADESLTSCFKQRDRYPHPGSIYKNIVVTSHAQQMVFIFVSLINYIIIAIGLVWLYRMLKRQKT